MTDIYETEEAGAWLGAIVANSFDAILSKTLDGTITSWNAGAERLFGYSANDAIGRNITLIIPPNRHDEEDAILARLRRGESVEHFETVRQHRDGRFLDIELTVSPVRDHDGHIIGASKIARDITERKKLREEQALMVREMHHRIKNLLAVVHSLVGFSRRQASDIDEFATDFAKRILALGSAHDLILIDPARKTPVPVATLGQVVEAVLKPYFDDGRIRFAGCRLPIGPNALTTMALLLHELATNAIKHGALSKDDGFLDIDIHADDMVTRLVWRETGGVRPAGHEEGHGAGLLRIAAIALDGKIERDWEGGVFTISVEIPAEKLTG